MIRPLRRLHGIVMPVVAGLAALMLVLAVWMRS